MISSKAALLAAKESRNTPHTRLETLRAHLNDLQLRIVRLREQTAENALAILPMMDEANALLAELRDAGSPVSGEETFFETIQAQFYKKRRLFISRIGGAAALAEMRAKQQPPPPQENHWWFVDKSLAAERRRLLRSAAIALVALIIVAIALGAAYQRFWAPDPALQAAIGWQSRAENALLAGDYQAALEAATNAIALLPDQPELYLLQGVSYAMLGRPAEAGQSFAAAWDLYPEGGQHTFYIERAGYYLMSEQGEPALADAQAALDINPDAAIARLRQAQAYELLGEREQAIAAYQQAADAAQREGNAQLEIVAKMSLANLLSAPEQ